MVVVTGADVMAASLPSPEPRFTDRSGRVDPTRPGPLPSLWTLGPPTSLMSAEVRYCCSAPVHLRPGAGRGPAPRTAAGFSPGVTVLLSLLFATIQMSDMIVPINAGRTVIIALITHWLIQFPPFAGLYVADMVSPM